MLAVLPNISVTLPNTGGCWPPIIESREACERLLEVFFKPLGISMLEALTSWLMLVVPSCNASLEDLSSNNGVDNIALLS